MPEPAGEVGNLQIKEISRIKTAHGGRTIGAHQQVAATQVGHLKYGLQILVFHSERLLSSTLGQPVHLIRNPVELELEAVAALDPQMIFCYTSTMITALRCSAELDASPIYCKEPLSLQWNAEYKQGRA